MKERSNRVKQLKVSKLVRKKALKGVVKKWWYSVVEVVLVLISFCFFGCSWRVVKR